MIILSSPAKTLDYDADIPDVPVTKPMFVSEASLLVGMLRLYSEGKLATVLEVSDSLANLNYERFKNWSQSHTKKNSRQAIFAYKGDVFEELSLKKYSKKQLEFAQRSLRIISGLYGILRPFDLIQPYRLEMGATLKVGSSENLYQFWTDKVTTYLKKEIAKEKHELILNMASQQYSKAVRFSELDAPAITIDFKQNVKGRIKNYGLLSKRARGAMIDYCIRQKVESIDKIKKFDLEGYKFESEKGSRLLFVKM